MQLDLLRAVMKWDPPAWIFGGFAEDALLHGHSSRVHEDVDVLVLRKDLDRRIEQARAFGYVHVHTRLAADPERPLVVGCWRAENDLLELSVFEEDEEGRIYWEKPTPDGTARLYLPDDTLATPPSRLEGVEVRTISPLALYQLRTGVTDLFGGMRDKDRVSQAKLRERFFPRESERALAPRIVPDRVAARAG